MYTYIIFTFDEHDTRCIRNTHLPRDQPTNRRFKTSFRRLDGAIIIIAPLNVSGAYDEILLIFYLFLSPAISYLPYGIVPRVKMKFVHYYTERI